MSRVLDQFPDVPARQKVDPRYDWSLWLDGRVHALHPSEYGDPYVFRNAAHACASRRGLALRTALIGDEMVVQASAEAVRPFRARPPRRRSA